MGEDLFAQTCLDLHGVRRADAFDVTTDGACPADRPEGEKKNKKWKPNCDEQNTPAYHPFKKPDSIGNAMGRRSPNMGSEHSFVALFWDNVAQMRRIAIPGLFPFHRMLWKTQICS